MSRLEIYRQHTSKERSFANSNSDKMPAITLHYWPNATSLAAHILLRASDLSFTLTKVPLDSNGQIDASFRNVNPKGLVPVLVLDDDTVITESTAVMTAIAQLAPTRQWLGRSDIETVRVYEWMNWLSGTVHGQVWLAIYRPYRFCDEESAHEAIRDKGTRLAAEVYAAIEGKLNGGYAVGGHLTIVDAFLYVLWRWAVVMKIVGPATHPRYATLVKQMETMPFVVEALEVEGLEILK